MTFQTTWEIYVAVNFLFQLIFVFPLFLGMVMYANEFETKEKQKLTEIKNKLQHIFVGQEALVLSLTITVKFNSGQGSVVGNINKMNETAMTKAPLKQQSGCSPPSAVLRPSLMYFLVHSSSRIL